MVNPQTANINNLMGTLPGLLIMALLLAVNAAFVAAEFSLIALDRAAIEAQAANGSRLHRRLLRSLTHLTETMSGFQFGITVSALLLGFVAEPTVARLLTGQDHPTGLSVVMAIAVATALHLVIGEQVPKYLALASPEKIARRTVPLLAPYSTVVRPLVAVLNHAANAILRRFGVVPRHEISNSRSVDELEDLITASVAGGLNPEEVKRLTRSLHFGDKTASDVLVPRPDIEALAADASVADLIERSQKTGYSRFLVYGNDLDDVVGLVHVKGIYRLPVTQRADTPISELMQEVQAVPETRSLAEIMVDFRQHQTQMALVIDEHGATAGLLTLEDLLEEILGDISDEHDQQLPLVRPTPSGDLLAAGRLNFDEVYEATGFTVPEGPYETLAGFVLTQLGHLPQLGETIEHQGWCFEVMAMEGRRIALLRVVKP
ncbi:MAG TPA: HlyC/CorC family transporter [Acidimicrobiia bacterium]|jgi:CBS domain containing-hemolysin-like protein|nr:HlyC/CorC family transporter [Acidimicrobiia bacterium]HIL46684.1 HlyC/CorC family transporter [Acidimicrobiia bacterium]